MGGVTGAQGKLGGGLADRIKQQLAVDPDVLAGPIDPCASGLPNIEGLIIEEVDADLLQDVHRSLVDALDLGGGEHLDRRHMVFEHLKRQAIQRRALALLTARGAAFGSTHDDTFRGDKETRKQGDQETRRPGYLIF